MSAPAIAERAGAVVVDLDAAEYAASLLVALRWWLNGQPAGEVAVTLRTREVDNPSREFTFGRRIAEPDRAALLAVVEEYRIA